MPRPTPKNVRCILPTAAGFFGSIAVALSLWPTRAAGSERPVDFNRDVRPILSDACFACHGPDEEHRQGAFRLDVKESAHGAADSGAHPIVPGDAAASELVARITSDDPSLRMPPEESNKKLTPEQSHVLQEWIAQGAPWAKHWSLTPPRRPALPDVKDNDFHGPIDRFVLARLEREGFAPSPEADRETLLRRVTLDLTGLPPTLEEIDAFLADQSPRAYENVVDRLLASTAYGEHFARYWLDAARYADTHGLQRDGYREMWGYRDWVIAAFNRNLPFDQFIIEQLAGDLLPAPTRDQVVATGFNRCHATTGETGVIEAEIETQNVVDRVTTFGTVFLGLTLDCTRCHDHKFDALTMADFYSLYAYFNSLDGPALNLNRPDHPPVLPIATVEQQKVLDEYDAQIASLQAKNVGAAKLRAGPELDAAKQELARVQAVRAELTAKLGTTPIWKETPEPRPTFILDRGLYDQPGEPVARRTPSSLPSMDASLPNNRLGLAKWLVDPRHPLTARVGVNRFWQQAFGTGLVKTSEDFGSQGEPPSHPELLDWLAVDYIESGWDVKALMKQIVTSATYRQSSRATPEHYERDPENCLLARGPRGRLDAEALRDQALAVSGLLVDKIGGPSVKPPQPAGLWEAVAFSGGEQPGDTFRFVADVGSDKIHRRTLYTFIKRTAAPPQLTTFDATARESCTVRRERTNTPLQALLLLNDPQYIEAARGLATLTLNSSDSEADRAKQMFRRATGRRPNAADLQNMLQGLERQLAYFADHEDRAEVLLAVGAAPPEPSLDRTELAAWTMTANLLLNLDEVVTKN